MVIIIIIKQQLLKSYQKDYKPSLVDEKENHIFIDFLPKHAHCAYSKILVTINKDDLSIQEIKISEKSGVEYTISVMNLVENPTLNDSIFVYQAR